MCTGRSLAPPYRKYNQSQDGRLLYDSHSPHRCSVEGLFLDVKTSPEPMEANTDIFSEGNLVSHKTSRYWPGAQPLLHRPIRRQSNDCSGTISALQTRASWEEKEKTTLSKKWPLRGVSNCHIIGIACNRVGVSSVSIQSIQEFS